MSLLCNGVTCETLLCIFYIVLQLGFIRDKYVAHITKEGVFAMSQLTEDTELVIIDEWSKETMCSDVVKNMLQG